MHSDFEKGKQIVISTTADWTAPPSKLRFTISPQLNINNGVKHTNVLQGYIHLAYMDANMFESCEKCENDLQYVL